MDFHDSNLCNLFINFETQEIKLSIEKYNDSRQEYDEIEMKFLEVFDIQISDTILNVPLAENIDFLELNRNNITISLLLGFGKPSGEIKFKFKECKIRN